MSKRRTGLGALKELDGLATNSGFKLLENEWLGSGKKHRFVHLESNIEYSWEPRQIFNQGFPKDIRSDKDRFNALAAIATNSGFKLLENEWLGGTKEHLFINIESNIEYRWKADNILRSGFPKEFFHKLATIATNAGFKLLETEWLGSDKQHRFVHLESNIEYNWSAAQILSSGFPLNDGQKYVTEEVCRQVFKHLFGGTFKTNRNRLKQFYGKSIELDGLQKFDQLPSALLNCNWYNNQQSIEIAFEFQGHRNHQEDNETMARDKLKVEYCNKAGILLVVIEPPINWNKYRDSEFMYLHVFDSIKNSNSYFEGLEFKQGFKIDLSNWNNDLEKFNELNILSCKNGFKLLEPTWLGPTQYHLFLHIQSNIVYSWVPKQIFSKGFPKDLRSAQDRLNELAKIATNAGYKLLETEWLNGKNKHRFLHIESNIEHSWTADNIFHKGFPNKFKREIAPL